MQALYILFGKFAERAKNRNTTYVRWKNKAAFHC